LIPLQGVGGNFPSLFRFGFFCGNSGKSCCGHFNAGESKIAKRETRDLRIVELEIVKTVAEIVDRGNKISDLMRKMVMELVVCEATVVSINQANKHTFSTLVED